MIGHKREVRALICREALRGVNQNTECIYDSQWEGCIFLSANQKEQQMSTVIVTSVYTLKQSHNPTCEENYDRLNIIGREHSHRSLIVCDSQ